MSQCQEKNFVSKAQEAEGRVKEGFSCAQSMFSTYCTDLGMDYITGLRVAGTMGGGICNMGEVCGAVTAGVMLLGLQYGRTKVDDLEAKERSYGLSREFIRRFRERTGAFRCRELIGCDINTEIGAKCAADTGVIKQLCPGFVRTAAEIYEELLQEQKASEQQEG